MFVGAVKHSRGYLPLDDIDQMYTDLLWGYSYFNAGNQYTHCDAIYLSSFDEHTLSELAVLGIPIFNVCHNG